MSDEKQKYTKTGMLDGPLLSCAIEKYIRQLKKEPAWLSSDRNAITLVKSPRLGVVLVVLRKATSLR